jgi:hypothetical protein
MFACLCSARVVHVAAEGDLRGCRVWEMRDGKIMNFQQYTDTAQWQDVEGAR